MTPRHTASDDTPANGNGGIAMVIRSWIIVAVNLGVGAAFGCALLWMFWTGMIEPQKLERQAQSEDRQKLLDSTLKTNESLTKTNEQMAETLDQIKISAAESSAVVLQAVQTNGRTIGIVAEAMHNQTAILDDRTSLFAEMSDTHKRQCDSLDKMNLSMDAATQMMGPSIKQREMQLQKQDETILLQKETNLQLKSLTEAVQAKNP
jgi:hypothetical protein